MSTNLVSSTGRPKPPNAGKGRKAGSKNKLTQTAKEAFEHAFNEIGGGSALATWASENRTDFYKLFARLIPNEQRVAGAEGGAVRIEVGFVSGR